MTMTRILAVDDSPSMRQMVGVTLKSAGYEVLEACDGREARRVMTWSCSDGCGAKPPHRRLLCLDPGRISRGGD
jgi:hypothetical protein